MFSALGPCSLELWVLVLGLGIGVQTRSIVRALVLISWIRDRLFSWARIVCGVVAGPCIESSRLG